MKHYGKGKRVVALKEISIQKREYRAKHSKMDAYKGEKYTESEKLLISTQTDPITKEHLTLAQISNRLNRTLAGVETEKKILARKNFRKMPSDAVFAAVGALV